MNGMIIRWISFHMGLWYGKTIRQGSEKQLREAKRKAMSYKEYTHYYILLDLKEVADSVIRSGSLILLKHHHLAFPFFLAQFAAVVALDGTGFDAKKYTMRISLSNNSTAVANDMGQRIRFGMNAMLKDLEFATKRSAIKSEYIYGQCT